MKLLKSILYECPMCGATYERMALDGKVIDIGGVACCHDGNTMLPKEYKYVEKKSIIGKLKKKSK